MNIRLINLNEDYNIIDTWQRERNLPIIQQEYLSNFGYLAFSGEKAIAACWLYPFIGSKKCLLDNLISNPNSNKEERKEAMNLLFKTICNEAKKMGYKEIHTLTNHHNVEKEFLNINFEKQNETYNYFIRSL